MYISLYIYKKNNVSFCIPSDLKQITLHIYKEHVSNIILKCDRKTKKESKKSIKQKKVSADSERH